MLVLTAKLHDGHSNNDREATHVECACGRTWRFWINRQMGSANRVKVVVDAPRDVNIVRGKMRAKAEAQAQQEVA